VEVVAALTARGESHSGCSQPGKRVPARETKTILSIAQRLPRVLGVASSPPQASAHSGAAVHPKESQMSAIAVAVSVSAYIKPGAELGLMYAEALLKTIPADVFAHMPSKGPGKDVNSAAFNIGHLSLYPDSRILSVIGRDDLVKPLPYSADLFKAGALCVDEPGKYPAMDVIVSTFFDRYRVTLDALTSVPDETFAKTNPLEGRMRELFPTIGALVTFMLVGHVQSHLGQVSVWRRLVGLGSAF